MDKIQVVFTYPMRSWLVEILYIEYEGGGECWEFRVYEGGVIRHQSDDGYGNPEAAARDAFGWINDSGMEWKNS